MKTWEILNRSKNDVIDILLENRGLKSKQEKEEFFKPTHPSKLTLRELQIDSAEMKKVLKRIKLAKENHEKVIVYGDYDADGVTATAIMWEGLHKHGVDVMPYIPDRFKEGYGINFVSVQKLKDENPELKLIITVDNGIVALDAIKIANKLGIDVIITDHHAPEKLKPKAYAIIHTTLICGSALSYIVSREITGHENGLELAGIGTIADQMPLTYADRSFAKHGIAALKKTKRAGLLELIKLASVKQEEIGTYEINYVIAPRINSMGRLNHAIESLRLLCTTNKERARDLANLVSKTNFERQEIVEKTVLTVSKRASEFSEGIIILGDEKYHEGIIGLAAGRIVEEFYRPAIVISVGKEFSKGSARSINGFNIIEAIREQADILVAHGGHPMAAGFTIETSKIEDFRKRITKAAKKKLTQEILNRKLKIDCEIGFDQINWELEEKIEEFDPTGMGNPQPTFLTKNVEISQAKLLGKDKNHVKLKLKKDGKFFDAIGFNLGNLFLKMKDGVKIDVVYGIEKNEWNGVKSLQLKIRDLKV